jgi:hypothetical protein
VAYGQTTITSANIVVAPGAPYLPCQLPNLRTRVTGQYLDLYVAPTGNDDNPGTNASAPFLTINGALSACAANYDLTGSTVRLHLANGTYGGLLLDGTQVTAPVSLIGNVGSPGSVVISQTNGIAVLAANKANLTISGLTVTATGSSADYQTYGVGLYANGGGSIIIGASVVFGACGTFHMYSAVASYISVLSAGAGLGGAYTINGSAQCHWNAVNAATISAADSTITLIGTPNFSIAFALVGEGGSLNVWNINFIGSATGPRYSAGANAQILVQGAGANYLPGSTAGSASNGGVYF